MKYLDLINQVGDMLGWGQMDAITDDPSPEFRKIVRVANSVLSAMQGDRDWPELREDGFFAIVAPVTFENNGVFTKGSATLAQKAGDLLDFNDYIGYVVKVNGHDAYYTIIDAAAAPGATATLDRIYTGETTDPDGDATEGDMTLGKLTYSLPSDYDRLLSNEIYNRDTGTRIYEISPTEMRKAMRDNGTNFLEQEATKFTIHGIDGSGNKQLHFDAAFDDTYSVEYEYQKKHPAIAVGAGETNDDILYPERYGLYIIDQIIAKLSRDVENSAMVQQQAADALKEAVRSNSSPSNSRERSTVQGQSLRHGAYRRR